MVKCYIKLETAGIVKQNHLPSVYNKRNVKMLIEANFCGNPCKETPMLDSSSVHLDLSGYWAGCMGDVYHYGKNAELKWSR